MSSETHDPALLNRREALQAGVLASVGAGLTGAGLSAVGQPAVAEAGQAVSYRLSTFRIDATPPMGHPCCGGWIEPIKVVDDPMSALGLVLQGAGDPIVICVFDWVGILNDAHIGMRQAIAKAVGTRPERVAIQCLHPHNAPFADVVGQKLLAAETGTPNTLDLPFFDRMSKEISQAAKDSLARAVPVTHVGTGLAKVIDVASNRRIVGPEGKVIASRTSACRDPKTRALPVGLIDPHLRTVSFWNGDTPVAALHYYACHPMSYYGDGRATPDFCGLARDKRQKEMAGVFQMYFDGCGGNVTAGKYNDGSPENRPVLRDRIYDAMVEAWKATRKTPLTQVAWRSQPVTLPLRTEEAYQPEALTKVLKNEAAAKALRGRAAMQLSWLARKETPIEITCLDLGTAQLVHLPGEPFIEYQLFSQSVRDDRFVCVAGYGDGGTWYIPVKSAYPEGGYEVSVAFVSPDAEAVLHNAMRTVQRPAT